MLYIYICYIYVLYIYYIYIYVYIYIQQWPTLNLYSFNGWRWLLSILRESSILDVEEVLHLFLVKTERKERNASRFLIELLIRIL